MVYINILPLRFIHLVDIHTQCCDPILVPIVAIYSDISTEKERSKFLKTKESSLLFIDGRTVDR